MDVGASIALSSAILGIVAVIFRIFPRSEKGKHCDDHSGVCASMDNFTDWLNKIEKKLDRVIERREYTRGQ